MDTKKTLTSLPDSCGVYIMKSKKGDVLYIGKAASIRKRVPNHFNVRATRGTILKNTVADIECIVCDTEEQALLLEASLIKEKKPKYNVALRDDKSYPYVVITKDKYSRIHIRRSTQVKGGILFGPFTNVKLLRKALHLIRKIFPYCSCKKPREGCLYYHLHLCPGPQITTISDGQYKENIDSICKILRGERKKLIEKLQAKMEHFVRVQQFEQAAKMRDQLVAVYSLYSGKRQVNELLMLKEALDLKKIPFIIEAIDISSLSGKEAGGSVVVFKDGIPDKNRYRRYRIKQVEGIDDYMMIAEVVKRRYSRVKEERMPLPELIIIDGGYGHVRTAKKQLDALGLKTSLIGIAKKNEEVWFPYNRKSVLIAKDNQGLHILQRIRNEAHRFAHSYHTLLRKRKIVVSKKNK